MGVFIVGAKFEFFRHFQIFLSSNGQKRLVFNSNGQIRIQTVTFKFKRINQEVAHHYRPPNPVVGGSASGIDRAVVPELAPTRSRLMYVHIR
jgi:hypothetical protein